MRISDWSSDVCSSDLQSNIPYAEAANLHKLLLRTGYRIGSPAPEEGHANKWLLDFMNEVNRDTIKVDFIALHWYDWGNWSSAHKDRKSTRLNSSHYCSSRMPSSA